MIYIVKHRKCETPKLKGYKDLYVGDECNYLDKDNINYLNSYISEATASYYLWKHCKDKYVGQVHYRRYLLDNGKILEYSKALEYLKEYDMLFAEPYRVGNGIYNNLRNEIGNDTNKQTLDKYYDILCEKEPELRDYFNQTWFYPRNMFVCKKELFNKYCEWLFPIIIPITEQFIKEDKEINQKNKLVGYLYERLFTYWIIKNDLKVKTFEYNETGDRLPMTEV